MALIVSQELTYNNNDLSTVFAYTPGCRKRLALDHQLLSKAIDQLTLLIGQFQQRDLRNGLIRFLDNNNNSNKLAKVNDDDGLNKSHPQHQP